MNHTVTIDLRDVADIDRGLPAHRRLWVAVQVWAARHATGAAVLLPLLALVGVVHAVGMSTFPGYVDDPGTYLSQAWSLRYEGQLSPYSYFYDHAPAGWIQIAAWAALTDGFDRYDSAMAFGNEVMLIAKLVSTLLVYLLGRRLGFGRPAATVAALLFGLCPLGVVYGRWTFLDNMVTPWLLLAFLLAYSPRRSILAGIGAALSFGMAALTKETALVVLPAFAWAVVQNTDRRNRAQVLLTAASTAFLLMVMYPLFALYKGELVLLAGLAAVPVALLVRRLRPLTAVLVVQWLVLVRGGYVPFMHVINLMPVSALLIAGAGSALAGNPRLAPDGWLRPRTPGTTAARLRLGVAAVLLVGLVGTAAVTWPPKLRSMMTVSQEQPLRTATTWVADNVPRDEVLVVHDAIWTDLVHHYGFDPRPVIVYKLDTDPAVRQATRRVDYLVVPDWYYTTGDAQEKYPTLLEARKHAVVVASFGTGDDRVCVYRVSEHWELP